MINLIFYSGLVITDSGGLQKEAYFFRKYCHWLFAVWTISLTHAQSLNSFRPFDWVLYKASGSIDCSTHDVAFDQLKTTKLINNYTINILNTKLNFFKFLAYACK